jgi:hypothetical protein
MVAGDLLTKMLPKQCRAVPVEKIEIRLERKEAVADDETFGTKTLGQMIREQRHKLLYGDRSNPSQPSTAATPDRGQAKAGIRCSLSGFRRYREETALWAEFGDIIESIERRDGVPDRHYRAGIDRDEDPLPSGRGVSRLHLAAELRRRPT